MENRLLEAAALLYLSILYFSIMRAGADSMHRSGLIVALF